VVRNSYTQYWEEHPDELQPFPAQFLRSVQDGANHLGSDENAEVDPDKSSGPPARVPARSTSWCLLASWSTASSTRGRDAQQVMARY
jgi:hypothetical protein